MVKDPIPAARWRIGATVVLAALASTLVVAFSRRLREAQDAGGHRSESARPQT